MFCYTNYATYKDTINSFSGLVATIVGTILTCLSNTQRVITLSITEEEYVAISAFAQEVTFVSMIFEEITEV